MTEDSSGPPPARRRRPSTIVLLAAAAVVAVAVVLAIVVPIVLGGSDKPGSPRAAAQAWGNAALHQDQGKLKSLSCTSQSNGFGVSGLIFNGTGVKAGTARPTGSDSWDVPITTVGPLGGTSITVHVERKHGSYLVC